ncbi:MAG: hypothetical protein L0332_14190 [Chloroflexi bacterium]|nr:hypothetical protein [Chloroflexota bacterium]MCI0579330.1 hypothetical protein [Chloroflexota bacterium]MCI0644973.1 hypothetical protein [Chloroflexota bacterium]MCI0727852.1 hypothetical protein [Chloroflexota bacterium]
MDRDPFNSFDAFGRVFLWLLLPFLAACGVPAAQPTLTARAPAIATLEPTPTTAATIPPAPIQTLEPAGSPTVLPTEEPKGGPRLFSGHIYGDGPAVSHDPDIAWYSNYGFTGGIVFFDGLYYMFVKGFGNSRDVHGVGYSASPDGFNWTPASETPLFLDLDFGAPSPLPETVLLDGDQLVMYLWGWQPTSSTA